MKAQDGQAVLSPYQRSRIAPLSHTGVLELVDEDCLPAAVTQPDRGVIRDDRAPGKLGRLSRLSDCLPHRCVGHGGGRADALDVPQNLLAPGVEGFGQRTVDLVITAADVDRDPSLELTKG